MNRRLGPEQRLAHDGVDPVRADQHVDALGRAVLERDRDRVALVGHRGDAAPQLDRRRAAASEPGHRAAARGGSRCTARRSAPRPRRRRPGRTAPRPSCQRRNSHAISNGDGDRRAARRRRRAAAAAAPRWARSGFPRRSRPARPGCSKTRTSRTPARKRNRAAERPPNPPPAIATRGPMPRNLPAPPGDRASGRPAGVSALRRGRRQREHQHLAVAAGDQRLVRRDRLLEADRQRMRAHRRRERQQAQPRARSRAPARTPCPGWPRRSPGPAAADASARRAVDQVARRDCVLGSRTVSSAAIAVEVAVADRLAV